MCLHEIISYLEVVLLLSVNKNKVRCWRQFTWVCKETVVKMLTSFKMILFLKCIFLLLLRILFMNTWDKFSEIDLVIELLVCYSFKIVFLLLIDALFCNYAVKSYDQLPKTFCPDK